MARDRDGDLAVGHYLKRRKIRYLPIRIGIGLLLFSLPAGGPHRFYATLPGQVFACMAILQGILERVLQAPDFGGKDKDRTSYVVGWFGYFLTFVVGVVEFYWFPDSWHLFAWSPLWVYAAIGLWVVGIAVRITAIRTLGRYFTAHVRIQQDQKVIQHGIYRFVRHPSYTGMLLIGLGFVTLHASAAGYVAWCVLALPAMLNRIFIEEKVLKKELGEPYKEYSRRVKRLVPFVF